ncbi:hypothetical protein ACV3J7_04930 [Salmonella enterica]
MTTNNHPAHGPVSLDRLHQISEILSKAAAQSDGGNLGYAMADAVKVIDGAIAAFGAEPVAYWRHAFSADGFCYADGINSKKYHDEHPLSHLSDGDYWRVTPLYTAPPSPVVNSNPLLEFVKEYIESWSLGMAGDSGLLASAKQAIADSAIQQPTSVVPPAIEPDYDVIKGILPTSNPDEYACCIAADMWNACRATMLQAGNHTEQHLDMVEHSGDANEKVDCRLPFDQWLSQQNEPIDVDCGCVTTEVFYHWLRVAYEAGNSPVTPDGWQLVPKKITLKMECAISRADSYEIGWQWALAAAPKYEVK